MSTEPIFNTSAVTAAAPESIGSVADENDDDLLSCAAHSVHETISISSHTSSSSLHYSYSINSSNSEQVASDIGHGSSSPIDAIASDRKSISSIASAFSGTTAVAAVDTNPSKRTQSFVRLMAKRFEEIQDPQQSNHEANFNECNWWLKAPSVTYLEDDVLCNDDKSDRLISDFSKNCDIQNEQFDFQTDVINDSANENEQMEGVKSRIFRLNQLSNSVVNLTKKHFSSRRTSNSNFRYIFLSSLQCNCSYVHSVTTDSRN